jgi:hypothetical protein
MTNICVETDAQQLVHAVSSKECDLSLNGVLFREIKTFAFLNFTTFSISYWPRACNKVADAIAKFGANMVHQSQAVWPGGAPTFAHVLVASDLRSTSY